MTEPELLTETLVSLKAAVPLGTRVLVFGSRARGDAGQDSDLDLLVIEPQVADRAADTHAQPWVLGFHARQAVEKALKAVRALHRFEFPRTHNLSRLVELLRRQSLPLPPAGDDLARLIPFGVALRHDDMPDDEPTLDRDWAVHVAADTLKRAAEALAASASGAKRRGREYRNPADLHRTRRNFAHSFRRHYSIDFFPLIHIFGATR